MATTNIIIKGTQEEMEEVFENNKGEFDISVRWYEIKKREENSINFFTILRHPNEMNFIENKTYSLEDLKNIQNKYEKEKKETR